MDPSQHTRVQRKIETVDCSWRIEAEEAMMGLLANEVMATFFWDTHGIIHTSKRQFEAIFSTAFGILKKSGLSPGQCAGAQVRSRNVKTP